MQLKLTNKLEPFRSKQKRIKIAFGGRGGTKSTSVAKILAMRVQTEHFKVGCFREHQNTLDDSVHALLKEVILDMQIPGYRITDKHISHEYGGGFKFRGLARNLGGVKSFHGFKVFWVEEGEFLSENSLKILLPTLREQNSELWITLNPQYEEDAVSQRYILPHYEELLTNGFYEDEDLYIVWTNWDENPWFPEELQRDRVRDYASLPRSEYDHIWLGFFDTKVENSLIQREWFDACINAHKKLGFKPVGVRMASHDPSDTGPDDKGFAYRHGSVVLDLQEKKEGDINEGGDWATELALQWSVDALNWDCDGMGVGLNRQFTDHFKGKPMKLAMFKGSESPDFPNARYENATSSSTLEQKTNKESLKNKRAQYYLALRNRIYNTYLAVTKGQWHNEEKLISFSKDLKLLPKLRSELCRMPIKPNHNGLFELYTKQDLKKLFKFKSPNLADSVMMMMRVPQFDYQQQQGHRPKPVKPMGIGA